jgi:anthranilate phosphoribosyltransferase
MRELLDALINRRRPVDLDMCRAFWDRLGNSELHLGEAAALLACLSTDMPSAHTVEILVRSLDERRPQPSHRFPGSVNIVGTGGGPRTFNISTAAAFVAAAMGVPVVKTGSRGYTSQTGSFDLLDCLGIPLTTSYQQTGELLDRYNIACAGYFVYPAELAALARAVAPLQMRTLGRFVNTVGPFLAAMPVSAQVTGVSEHCHLATLRHLASRQAPKRIWLCTNDLGADELISIADNLVHDVGGQFQIRPDTVGLGGGALPDLLAAPPRHHSRVLPGGARRERATRSSRHGVSQCGRAGGGRPRRRGLGERGDYGARGGRQRRRSRPGAPNSTRPDRDAARWTARDPDA